MKITVDGLNLYKWCNQHNKNYAMIRKRIWVALNIERVKKPKRTYNQRLNTMKVRNRFRAGYNRDEAFLNNEDFDKLSASRRGLHKIGKYNLHYVCNQLGINYNTVYIICIKRKRMTPREYLESKGYDLTQFEE